MTRGPGVRPDSPLLTKADGTKLGKSTLTNGHVWLDAGSPSPFRLYQYFLNTRTRPSAPAAVPHVPRARRDPRPRALRGGAPAARAASGRSPTRSSPSSTARPRRHAGRPGLRALFDETIADLDEDTLVALTSDAPSTEVIERSSSVHGRGARRRHGTRQGPRARRAGRSSRAGSTSTTGASRRSGRPHPRRPAPRADRPAATRQEEPPTSSSRDEPRALLCLVPGRCPPGGVRDDGLACDGDAAMGRHLGHRLRRGGRHAPVGQPARQAPPSRTTSRPRRSGRVRDPARPRAGWPTTSSRHRTRS